jgi:hypothetical protein
LNAAKARANERGVDAKTGAWHGPKHTAPPVFDDEKKIWRWCGQDCATHDSTDDTCDPDDVNFRFCPGRCFTCLAETQGEFGRSLASLASLGLSKEDMDDVQELEFMLQNGMDLYPGHIYMTEIAQ